MYIYIYIFTHFADFIDHEMVASDDVRLYMYVNMHTYICVYV